MGSTSQKRVDSICVIGAGPSGLAAAKYLLAERTFSTIVIFEQRDNAGGLWNYQSCEEDTPSPLPVPQTDPYGTIASCPDGLYRPEPVVSPVYDLLETNIPRQLMGFSDQKWSDDCQLFPTHETVLRYLEHYGEDIRHLIHFRTTVLNVTRTTEEQWRVSVQHDTASAPSTYSFDAVLVASGHFDVPSIPSVLGIEAWNQTHPGIITHSKHYRRPQDFAQKKTVVVGNSASGSDIAAQISTVCKLPLLLSQKSTPAKPPCSSSTLVEKRQISEFIVEDRMIKFDDGSIESGIDAIVYCTGYFYSYPFLQSLQPAVITSGEHVENLYQHIFYRPQPTLAFVALNQKIIPFPVAQAQSSVIARVWSGRLDLPSQQEMETWEQDNLKETGGGRNFHVLKFPKDADYINMLHDWAVSVDQSLDGNHELRRRRMSISSHDASRAYVGKEPPYWGEREYWTRERFPEIKKAFQAFGEERRTKRTLEEVGFGFEEWKRRCAEESRRLL